MLQSAKEKATILDVLKQLSSVLWTPRAKFWLGQQEQLFWHKGSAKDGLGKRVTLPPRTTLLHIHVNRPWIWILKQTKYYGIAFIYTLPLHLLLFFGFVGKNGKTLTNKTERKRKKRIYLWELNSRLLSLSCSINFHCRYVGMATWSNGHVCQLWLVDFDPFFSVFHGSLAVAICNYDWRQRKTQSLVGFWS